MNSMYHNDGRMSTQAHTIILSTGYQQAVDNFRKDLRPQCMTKAEGGARIPGMVGLTYFLSHQAVAQTADMPDQNDAQ